MDFNLNKKTIKSYGENYTPDNLLKKKLSEWFDDVTPDDLKLF